MTGNYLSSGLFGILAYFLTDTVAIEAIVGGTVAGVDQFPYQVSVIINKKNICGGGIIDDSHVITAAHCVVTMQNNLKNLTQISILVGTNNLQGKSVRALAVTIKNIYVPEEFTNPPESSAGDIAVIKLNEPFKRNTVHKYLKTLVVASKKDITYAGKTARIAGFGWDWIITDAKNVDHGRNKNHFLNYADAKVLSNEQCHKNYPNHKHFITDKHLCAQIHQHEDRKTHGVCIGDSGGPLVINQTLVVGILSTGPPGCTERKTAAIYTRVSHYHEFIHNVVKGKPRRDIRKL